MTAETADRKDAVARVKRSAKRDAIKHLRNRLDHAPTTDTLKGVIGGILDLLEAEL